MEVVQTIKLSDKERLAIQKTLELCDEISDIAHTSMNNVFDYLVSQSEISDENGYSISAVLQIAEIG